MTPWKHKICCIPKKQCEYFAYRMEDILKLYHREYDDDTVLVCMDETSKQQTRETRTPLPTKPGQPAMHDHEYERNGTANLFMAYAPLRGWRHVKVTDRRTKEDFSHFMRDLVDTHFPGRNMVLVMDNLNTHHPASLYKTFESKEAERIVDRLQFHYTPKHGSWLNMAEIEIGLLSRQCLSRRIADRETMCREVAAWAKRRNNAATPVNWRFKTEDARIKLKSLYPSNQR